MTEQAPADWYPDPHGRHEHRYWDGAQWTEHVATRGVQAVELPAADPPSASVAKITTSNPVANVNKKVQRTMRKAGFATETEAGAGTIFSESVLVVNQKAKLIEVNAEYAVYNRHGQKVGAVREVGQNLMKKVVGVDQFSTRRLQIVDLTGKILLTLTQPVHLWKASVIVRGPNGNELGQIVQKSLGIISNFKFNLELNKQVLGTITGEGWDVWNFSIQDAVGDEIARVTKTWAGLGAEFFTTADNYVVEITRPLEDPLHSLVVAAALAIDTALRQGLEDRPGRQIRLPRPWASYDE